MVVVVLVETPRASPRTTTSWERPAEVVDPVDVRARVARAATRAAAASESSWLKARHPSLPTIESNSVSAARVAVGDLGEREAWELWAVPVESPARQRFVGAMPELAARVGMLVTAEEGAVVPVASPSASTWVPSWEPLITVVLLGTRSPVERVARVEPVGHLWATPVATAPVATLAPAIEGASS